MWLVHSHSSVKASAAGVDEASDHGVEDEGQNLKKKRREEAIQSMYLSAGTLLLL